MAAVTATANPTPTPPETCAVAFKEWAGVCDALGSGRQSLILRKGGISETSGEFRPEHPAFWLYPTHVHEAEQGLKTPGPARPADDPPDTVALAALAVVEWVGRVERLDQLDHLAGYHDWTETTILKRFHYRTPGLWALAVRVHARPDPWRVAVTSAHLGCKTWVPLESPMATAGLAPVLDDAEAWRRLDGIRSALGPRS